MPFTPTYHPLTSYLRPLTILSSALFLIALHQQLLHHFLAPILYIETAYVFIFYFVWKLFLRHCGIFRNPTVPGKRGWPLETMFSALVHQCATVLVFLIAVSQFLKQNQDQPLRQSLFQWWSTGFVAPYSWNIRFWDKLSLTMQLAEMYSDFIMYGTYDGFDLGYWAHHVLTFVAVMMVYCSGLPVGNGVFYASILEGGSIALNYNNMYPSKWGFRMRAICYACSRGVGTLILPLSMYWSWTLPRSVYPVNFITHAPLVAILLLNFVWLNAMIKTQLEVERKRMQ